jgi:serine/threonine-protein kinase HipA
MLIYSNNRMSQLSVCLEAALHFRLDAAAAAFIMKHQIQIIRSNWTSVCDEAELPEADRQFLWQRQFLNPFAFYGAPAEIGTA